MATTRIITDQYGNEIEIPRLATHGAAATQTEATQLTGTDPIDDAPEASAVDLAVRADQPFAEGFDNRLIARRAF